ncbi:GmrSD restriction endonuclease domain-containing protein [Arthrobacter sp. RIT-PI-e]|uniref:GmrSD restriction endonuclease domain-containing protein n=1 Tax=Arthrobacter sp. RIT-PI-e TaxID=1681197 RepID=UPI000AB1C11A
MAGLAFFVVVIGLISGGLSGGLIMAALFALATGLYTAVTDRPSWARLNGRRAGGITAGAAVGALLVGAAIAPAEETVPTAVAEETAAAELSTEPSTEPTPSSTPSQTATPTASATPSSRPTSSATPSSTATADVAPLDSDTVAEVDGDPAAPSDQPAANTAALALLETLPIKGRAPKTGYSREEFGPAWADVDRNGCDTRNDMLNRDLTDVVHTNSVPCKVESGTLDDPYTGTVIAFQRGQNTSSKVQIDHVVALSDAWQKGAQQLSADQRLAFANDPLNLQAADGPANQQKGDGDAATWLPPNRGYRCEYVARQISVKATYTLWVTQAEHDAMARVLSDCNGILAPTNQVAPSVLPPAPAPPPAPPPAPVETPAPEPVVTDMFANCTEAANAGYSNMVIGSPGYSPKLDRDGDGVACEAAAPAPAPAPPAPALRRPWPRPPLLRRRTTRTATPYAPRVPRRSTRGSPASSRSSTETATAWAANRSGRRTILGHAADQDREVVRSHSSA